MVAVSILVLAALVWLSLGAASVAKHALAVRAEASTILTTPGSDSALPPLDISNLAFSANSLQQATESPQWRLLAATPGIGNIASLVSHLAADLNDATRDLSDIFDESLSTSSSNTELVDTGERLEKVATKLDAVSEHAHELAGQAVLRPISRSLRQLANACAQFAALLREPTLVEN